MTRRNSLTALRIETCAGFVPRDARAERATSPEQKSSRSFHDLTTLTIREVIDFHSIPLYTTCTCNNNHFVLLLVFLLRLLHVVVVGISATLRILHFPPQKATVPALSPAIVVSATPPAISGHSSGTNITEIPYTTTAFNMTVLPKYEAELAYLVFQHIAEPIAERNRTRASFISHVSHLPDISQNPTASLLTINSTLAESWWNNAWM